MTQDRELTEEDWTALYALMQTATMVCVYGLKALREAPEIPLPQMIAQQRERLRNLGGVA